MASADIKVTILTRLKRPAYAKPLLMQRRAGSHPLEIQLVYGEQWREGVPPRVCITPAEYAPGTYDLSVFAGVKVTLLDQGLAMMGSPDDKFFDLIVELVGLECAIQVVPPARSGLAPRWANSLAWELRVKRQWPRWWSDDLDKKHKDYVDLWKHDYSTTLERGRGRAA